MSIALDALVLLERRQQIKERLRRDAESFNGRPQGDENGVARLAVVAGEQLVAPPGEEVEGAVAAAGLVGEVVGPAAVGVNGVEVAQQPARQEQRGDGEVLVVAERQPAAVGPRPRQVERRVPPPRAETVQLRGEGGVHGWDYTGERRGGIEGEEAPARKQGLPSVEQPLQSRPPLRSTLQPASPRRYRNGPHATLIEDSIVEVGPIVPLAPTVGPGGTRETDPNRDIDHGEQTVHGPFALLRWDGT